MIFLQTLRALKHALILALSIFLLAEGVFATKLIGNPNAPAGGTFYINLDGEPSGLNPLRGYDGYAAIVLGYVFDTLLSRNIETFQLEPALAEKYEISKDGKIITFVLREGAKFTDGSPVTVEDVKFSFEANLNEKLADAVRKVFFENIDRAEIVDAKTIRFFVKSKYFKNLDVLSGMEILPKHIYGDPDRKVSKTMLGSGAYQLEKYDQGQSLVLKKNKNWWGFKVDSFKGFSNFDKIVFRFIRDRTAQLESIKKGDLSYMALSPEQYLKQTEGGPWGKTIVKEQVENSAPKGTLFVAFNLKRPLFKDREVRLALSQLFNREFMIEKFFYNKYLPATGPWYQQSPEADPNTHGVKFSPVSARDKLKKAGWADTNKDGILDKIVDGQFTNFNFTILHPGAEWEKYLTVYKEELKKSGIDVQLKQLEWNAFQKTIDDRNFDMVALVWGGAVEGDPKQIWHTSSIAGNGSNFAGYSNLELDKMIDEARQELNRAKRQKMMRKIYATIANDHPYIFIANPRYAFYAHSSKIMKPQPTFNYAIGIDTWWFKE